MQDMIYVTINHQQEVAYELSIDLELRNSITAA